MEIKLHFLPELPPKSCEVITWHINPTTGNLYTVMNAEYSARYELFNCYDFFPEEKVDISRPFNRNMVAWSYMDEAKEGIIDEINR